MARSKITATTNDVITDAGSILWSFIIGEQLEFPITLTFIEDATLPYTFEAVVIEAANTSGQTTPPTTVEISGVQTVLTVRVPSYEGVWNASNAYNMEDLVLYNGLYYKLLDGVAYINATAPDVDPLWELSGKNIVYVQFPNTLGTTWNQAPEVDVPVYGFFELRVTEPSNPIYVKTWKPVRGMVELLFSPTHVVPDV